MIKKFIAWFGSWFDDEFDPLEIEAMKSAAREEYEFRERYK